MKFKFMLVPLVILGMSMEGCIGEPSIQSFTNPIWITPQDSVCQSNGGRTDLGKGCRASWGKAKKICLASGGRVATIAELKKVITDCGGKVETLASSRALLDKNEENTGYQQCYKKKGFSNDMSNYWSLSLGDSGGIRTPISNAQSINFKSGYETGIYQRGSLFRVRCVRGGK